MTGLLVVLAAIVVVAAYIAYRDHTDRHPAQPLTPTHTGMLDAASAVRCDVETICPANPYGTVEQCNQPPGHRGPHMYPHEEDHDVWWPCSARTRDREPCCLEHDHGGPHLATTAGHWS